MLPDVISFEIVASPKLNLIYVGQEIYECSKKQPEKMMRRQRSVSS